MNSERAPHSRPPGYRVAAALATFDTICEPLMPAAQSPASVVNPTTRYPIDSMRDCADADSAPCAAPA